jgi:hypothetical protein
LRRTIKPIPKTPPIVIVPDKSYLDATGCLIPTELVVLTHTEYYAKFLAALYAESKQKKSNVTKTRMSDEKSKQRVEQGGTTKIEGSVKREDENRTQEHS